MSKQIPDIFIYKQAPYLVNSWSLEWPFDPRRQGIEPYSWPHSALVRGFACIYTHKLDQLLLKDLYIFFAAKYKSFSEFPLLNNQFPREAPENEWMASYAYVDVNYPLSYDGEICIGGPTSFPVPGMNFDKQIMNCDKTLIELHFEKGRLKQVIEKSSKE